ncbi:extracellular solute-binding protein [Lachnospiraceae bacterium 54-11]
MKKKVLALLMAAAMTAGLAGCGGNAQTDAGASADSGAEKAAEAGEDEASEAETAGTEDSGETATNGEKEDLVMVIDVPDENFNGDIMNMVKEKFGDEYNVVIKTWSGGPDTQQTLKTAALAGEQVDLVMYFPNSMNQLVDSDLAMPLDEYLTDEWKARFSEGALDIGTYNGKVYNLPYSTVYPMVAVNKDIADEAGITLSEDGKWTWDEFRAFCQTVSEKTDAFGSAIPRGWAVWLTRNANMQIWDTDEELEAFCAGEVSFLDDKIKEAAELVNDSFKADCFYPGGEAALALENDEAYAALASGKAASIFCVNSIVVGMLEETGLENYKIMDWPAMGPNATEPILGGCNGYCIPTTAKNIEGAVKVLDYLTGEECATVRAEAGCVSTVRIADGAQVDADLLSEISRCSDQIHKEINDILTEVSNVTEKTMPANYYFYGESTLEELEQTRLESLEAIKE